MTNATRTGIATNKRTEMIAREHMRNEAAQRPARGARQSHGFSLIELLVALAISVVLAALAVPEVMSTVHASRIRDSANQLSALIQQGRILAERQNVTLPVYTGTVQGSATGAFVPCITTTSPANCPGGGNSTSYVSKDPSVPYPGDIINTTSSVPSGLSPGFTPESAGTTMYFSPRGVAEKPKGAGYQLASGFALYLTDGEKDWAAVSVSPIGRTKVWMWNGKNWN